jgi:parvulin-like peptidyl-prolyl isomerase
MKFIWTMVLLAVLPGAALRARADLVDRVMAVVHDSPVTSQQIEFLSQLDEQTLRQTATASDDYQRKMLQVREAAFTNLVERQLILMYFKTLTNKINETLLDQFVTDEIHAEHSDRVQLAKDLERQGLTFEDFRQRVKEGLVIRELIHENVPEPIISPQKVEAYYKEHSEHYKVADQVKMRMIVLNKGESPEETLKRGEEILSQIKGGASFAQMATVNSEGSQRRDGGETGWEDTSEVNPALVKELDKLKPGQYSGVIDTKDTYFLLLLEDRHPEHIKPLSEVRDDVEKTLKNQQSERLRRRWIERLRTKTYIGYY